MHGSHAIAMFVLLSVGCDSAPPRVSDELVGGWRASLPEPTHIFILNDGSYQLQSADGPEDGTWSHGDSNLLELVPRAPRASRTELFRLAFPELILEVGHHEVLSGSTSIAPGSVWTSADQELTLTGTTTADHRVGRSIVSGVWSVTADGFDFAAGSVTTSYFFIDDAIADVAWSPLLRL